MDDLAAVGAVAAPPITHEYELRCSPERALHSDVGEDDWGEVTVWEPGRRLVHTFTLAQDPAYPSEVAVEFVPAEGGGCLVRFAHGGWTEANAAVREKFGDWRVMLDRYASLTQES